MLFTMRSNVSILFQSHNTSNSSSRHHNDNDESSEEEFFEVSLDEDSHGHRSLDTRRFSSSNHVDCESGGNRSQDTSHSNSSNNRGHGRRSSITSHSAYHNYGVYVDMGGYRSQETIHSYSRNWGTIVDVEARCVYKSLNSHYHPPLTKVNVVDCWIFKEIVLMLMVVLDIGPIPATINTKEDIVGVTAQDTEVGLKRSTTLTCSML